MEYILVCKDIDKYKNYSDEFILKSVKCNTDYNINKKNIITLEKYKNVKYSYDIVENITFIFDLSNLYPDGNNLSMVKDTIDDSKIHNNLNLCYYCDDLSIEFKLKVFKDKYYDSRDLYNFYGLDYYTDFNFETFTETIDSFVFDTENNLNIEEIYLSQKVYNYNIKKLTKVKKIITSENLYLTDNIYGLVCKDKSKYNIIDHKVILHKTKNGLEDYIIDESNIFTLDELYKLEINNNSEFITFIFDLPNLYPDGNNLSMVKDSIDNTKIKKNLSIIYYCNNKDIKFKLEEIKDEYSYIYENYLYSDNARFEITDHSTYKEEIKMLIFDTNNDLNIKELNLSKIIKYTNAITLDKLDHFSYMKEKLGLLNRLEF